MRSFLTLLDSSGLTDIERAAGSYNTLKSYPRTRYIANHAVLSTTDHLSTLYSSQSPLVIWARTTGLEIINELDSVKSAIMGGAGGAKSGPNASVWGGIASGIEGIGSSVSMLKAVGEMVGGQVKERLGRALK